MDKFKRLEPGKKLRVGSHECSIISYLSEGGFAHIYKVQISPPENNSDVACLKRVLVKDKTGLSQLRTEVKVMQKLVGCPNIVQYYDSHASRLSTVDSNEKLGYEVLVLMELCPNKSLLDFMNTRLKTKLKEIEILKIMYDISIAVSQLHYLPKPLIHRDIKIENVLIDAHRNFKLCDFGSTCHIIPPAKTKEQFDNLYQDILHQTTPQYRCPEMIDLNRRLPIDEKSDIWALGVFLYKLCFYITPFETQGQMAILNGTFSFPPVPRYSDSLKHLIIVMLQANPDYRPNIYQVVEIVCGMSNLTVPILDKYETGPHQYFQMLNNSRNNNPQNAYYHPPVQQPQHPYQHHAPQQQTSPPPEKFPYQQSSSNISGMVPQQLPSAGSIPSSFPQMDQSYYPAQQNQPPAVHSQYNQGPPPGYNVYPRSNNSDPDKDQNNIKSLTETLLQTTNEMIEDNDILKSTKPAQKQADKNNQSRSENSDLIDNAEVRYPSVDEFNNSFFEMADPGKASSFQGSYPAYNFGSTVFNEDSELLKKPNSGYNNNSSSTTNFLVPNKSNISQSGNNILYNSSSSINLTQTNDSNDFYVFEHDSSKSKSPSRQPSMKSRVSGKASRPTSYIELTQNHLYQNVPPNTDNTEYEFSFADNSRFELDDGQSQKSQYNTTLNEGDDMNTGVSMVDHSLMVDENNLLDFDDNNEDFFKKVPQPNQISQILQSNVDGAGNTQNLSEMRPKTPSNNPFPMTDNYSAYKGSPATTQKYHSGSDKNPWANSNAINKPNSSLFPLTSDNVKCSNIEIEREKSTSKIPEKHINELFLHTKSMVNDVIDHDDLVSPNSTLKFKIEGGPNDQKYRNDLKIKRKSENNMETLDTRLHKLSINTDFDRPYMLPYPKDQEPLLDIESPNGDSKSSSRNPQYTSLMTDHQQSDNQSSKLTQMLAPSNISSDGYGSVKSAHKIRELVNATEEIEVDLSSNSSIGQDEVEVEEEDPLKFLSNIQSVKSKMGSTSASHKPQADSPVDEFGNNDNIPTLPRMKSYTSDSGKSSPVGVSPVDGLFEKKGPKKSRFSNTFSKPRFKMRSNNGNFSDVISQSPPNSSESDKKGSIGATSTTSVHGMNSGAINANDFTSPISLDMSTKKKFGTIFSDSEDDNSIISDIKDDDIKTNEVELEKSRKNSSSSENKYSRKNSSSSENKGSSLENKKISRREKVRSFLGGSNHHYMHYGNANGSNTK
ncbi:serine/threonine protein kinase [Saccharomycopsis crataegensis]|uniref:Serine/threonine protein kinase n=1 Tax=Saccharomycopsis crataegensis TaxID=43959 RepID=A0AAV5QKS0_9ASCO|nr:serine/threonine protein kinase [Saccharomycopsis crataegensis]